MALSQESGAKINAIYYIILIYKGEVVHNENQKKIKENPLVYSSLRSEILLVEEMQRNMYLYMYSIFAALYALGVQFSHILFLVTYIVLIPFQSKINYYAWTITKMSVYIRVFFEETNNDMHWETFQTYPKHFREFKHNNNSIWEFFSRANTALLGILASISFVIIEVKNYNNSTNSSESIISGTLIFVAIVLAVLAGFITKQSLIRTDGETFHIIDDYKSDLEAGHNPKDFRLE